MYVYIYIYIFVSGVRDSAAVLAQARDGRTAPALPSTANIYTYTPIIQNTVYITLGRQCKHLLVVVHNILSRIPAAPAGAAAERCGGRPPRSPPSLLSLSSLLL